MKCKNCNNEMIVDDVDRLSKGSYDKYWICNFCDTSCVEEVRSDMTTKISWQEEN